jgi:hypothetical protein
VTISVKSYVIIMGLLFIHGTLAQVRACPKEMENTPRKPLDILPLGYHLKIQARASKLSWRSNPYEV